MVDGKTDSMKKFLRENWRILVCTVLALIAGMVIGVGIGLSLQKPEQAAEVSYMALVSIGPDTAIRSRLIFTECTHQYETQIAAAPYVGFTRAQLADAFPLCKISRFSAEEVLLERTVDGYCGKHLLLRSEQEGKLSVLQMNQDTLALENKFSVEFNAELLDAATLAELQSGVAFDTMDDLNAYLESVES